MTDLTGKIVLGSNQYGKAENRVVRIYRDSPRHGAPLSESNKQKHETSIIKNEFKNEAQMSSTSTRNT